MRAGSTRSVIRALRMRAGSTRSVTSALCMRVYSTRSVSRALRMRAGSTCSVTFAFDMGVKTARSVITTAHQQHGILKFIGDCNRNFINRYDRLYSRLAPSISNPCIGKCDAVI